MSGHDRNRQNCADKIMETSEFYHIPEGQRRTTDYGTIAKGVQMLAGKVRYASMSFLLLWLPSCAETPVEVSRDKNPAALIASSKNTPVDDKPTSERRIEAYLTGYSYWDNTPRGSTAISKPVIHSRAGGTGTYDDPITIAVGHVIQGQKQTLDFKPGTRFYLERLRKYAIVEDVCGDGNRPQDGPCHTGYKGRPWLDLYIGGSGHDAATANSCARRITALQPIIENPKPGYETFAGEVIAGGCVTF